MSEYFIAVTVTLLLTFYHPVKLQITTEDYKSWIAIKGEIVNIKNEAFYSLTCSSPKMPMAKSAEFIIDGKTVEHVSVYNDKCYNKHKQMCDATECSCVPSENSMKWITNKRGKVFACQMRFLLENGNVLKAFVSASFTETSGILYYDPVVTIMLKRGNEDNNDNNDEESRDITTEHLTVILPITIAVLLLFLSLGIIVWVYRRRKRFYRRHSDGYSDVPLFEMEPAKSTITTASCMCGGIKVTIGKFQLFKSVLHTDVVVVFSSQDLQLEKNKFTNSILHAAGSNLKSALDQKRQIGFNYGDVVAVSTKDFNLQFSRRLYIGCIPPINDNWKDFKEALELCLQNCLEEANNDAAESVTFYTPDTINETNEHYPFNLIAKCYQNAIETYKSVHTSSFTERIFIAIDEENSMNLKIENAFVESFGALEASIKQKPVFGNVDTATYQLHDVSGIEAAFVIDIVENTWLPQFVGKGRDGENLEELDYSRIRVIQVQKLCNSYLSDKYEKHKDTLLQKVKYINKSCDPLENIIDGQTNKKVMTNCYSGKGLLPISLANDINEYYLFHGAQEHQIPWIMQHGFNIINESKSFCGDAIYAFECSTKSDQYADNKHTRDKEKPKKMILGRFALGEMFVTRDIKKFSGPPCKTCKSDKCTTLSHNKEGFGFYDSIVIDGKWNFREFLVFDENQCFPEYVITYQRQ